MTLPGFVPSWSAEFPNDNPALHEGASWLCLSPCGAPRPVTRPRFTNPRSDSPPVEAPEPAAEPIAETLAAPEPIAETLATAQPIAETPAAAALQEETEAAAPETTSVLAACEDEASLEALTLELETCEESQLVGADGGASEPLSLDSMDFVVTLSSDDAVFDFDGDDVPATPHEDVAAVAPLANTESPVAADPFVAYVGALVDVARAAGCPGACAALPALLDVGAFDAAAIADDVRARLVAANLLCSSGAELAPDAGFVATASAWRDVLRGTTQDLGACGETTLDEWSADLLRALGVGQGTTTDVRRELRRRGVAAFGMLLAA